jgi:hypothetical protein
MQITYIAIGVVKRFLDALKGESILADVFPYFLDALSALVKGSLGPEVFRSLSLFVTYALQKPSLSNSRSPKTAIGRSSSRSSLTMTVPPKSTLLITADGQIPESPVLTKRKLGEGILLLYVNLLCEKGSTVNLKKFAVNVTNKVSQALMVIIITDISSGCYIF